MHHDLLALDVPLLRLQLPLDPAGLAEAAAAEAASAAATAQLAADAGAREGAPPAAVAAAVVGSSSSFGSSGGGRSTGSSPHTGLSSGSSSWQDLPQAGAAAATPGASTAVPPRERQVLVAASRLSLSVAAVGYARHAMLPLVQLPSLQLACSCQVPPAGSQRLGLLSCSSSPVHLSSSPPVPPALAPGVAAAAGAAPALAGAVVSYWLEVAAIDLGLHPSQLSMLASAVQLCEHELALLGREPPDSSTDTESSLTTTSGAAAEQQQQQLQLHRHHDQHKQQTPPAQPALARASAGHLAATASGKVSAAVPSGAVHSSQQQLAEAALGQAIPGSSAYSGDVCTSQQQQLPQGRLEAAIDSVGISLLGATLSSSCLKLEWTHLRACYATGGICIAASLAAASSPAMAGQQGPAAAAPSTPIALQPPNSSNEQHEVQLMWRQLSLHVLHPRLSYTHPLTPFAFASTIMTHRQVLLGAGC